MSQIFQTYNKKLKFANKREVLIKMGVVNYDVRIFLLVGEMNE